MKKNNKAKTAAKKTTATKAKTKMAKKSGKFSMINEIHEAILSLASVSKNGAIKLKRADLKNAIEHTFTTGAKLAASGERIRFPVIGALVARPVKARKAGKGLNPFTGEEITVKARPESRKPRWSFPKAIKETFADKKNW